LGMAVISLGHPGLLLLFSFLVTASLSVYAWRKRDSPSGLSLCLLMAAAAVWSLGYGLQFFATNLAQMKLLNALAYMGISTCPVFWAIFAARYTRTDSWITPECLKRLFIVPAVTFLMVASNDLHALFFSSVELGSLEGYRFLILEDAPFWLLHIAYSNIMVLLGLFLFIRVFFKVAPVNRPHVSFFLVCSLIPYAAHMAYLAGFRPYGFLDLTPLAFMISGLVLTLGVFTVRLFDITPIALDALFNYMPDAIIFLDTRSRLVNANPKARELLESECFNLSGDRVLFVNSVNAAERFPPGVEGVDFALEDRVFLTVSTGMGTPAGRKLGTLVVFHDITERRRVREQLSRLVELQRLVTKASADFISVPFGQTDRAIQRTLATIGGFFSADRAYVFLFRDDCAFSDNTHEWCAESIEPEIDNLQGLPSAELRWWIDNLTGGKCINIPLVGSMPPEAAREKVILEAQGVQSLVVVPLMAEGRLMGYLGFDAVREPRIWTGIEQDALLLLGSIMINAIMRERAEQALYQSESLARTVIDNSHIGISVRAPTGQLLLYNQAWRNLWEMTDERLEADLRPRERLSFDERDDYLSRYQQDVRSVFTKGGSFFIPEMRTKGVNTESGVRRTISQHFNGITDAEGRVERVVVLTTDISELKKAEKERENLQDQLNQSQKMESVGRLAGGVAHDFNNMLGAILGHAELALERVEKNNPLAADLEEIRSAAERSADLTRQLLAFARKQTVSPRVLDLNETVEGMLKIIRRLIGEDIELTWVPGANLGPVKMDPSQIDQILTNLCINARDAIGDTGKVSIETDVAILEEDFCETHPGSLPGEYVMLAVSDNGCGMDSEVMQYIFEPFFTTKDVGRGTGLGLATVYGIVKQNNGFIHVYSEPGQGTTLKVYLPTREMEGIYIPRSPGPKTGAAGSETILLVEDEPAILNVTRIMLERKGYSVLFASTPDEAIGIAAEHKGRIDLLLTDVVMPGMNGGDLARHIINVHPGIRCLFMSGYTANVIAHRGVLNEGVNFIQKPFSGMELAGFVRDALDSDESRGK